MKTMKTNRLYLYVSVAMFSLWGAGCSSDDTFEDQFVTESPKGVIASVADYQFASETATRTTLTPTASGISFAWKNGDQIGVYSESNAMLCYTFSEIEGSDAKKARFEGGGFDLKADQKYYSIYPYAAEKTSSKEVPIVYSGQRQLINNTTDHLSAYDYMTASAVATGPNEAIFNYSHLGAIVRIKIAVPEAGAYSSLTISSPSTPFITEGVVDLTATSASIVAKATDTKMTLMLGDESTGLEVSNSNLYITAYLCLAPVDLSGVDLTLTVTSAYSDSVKYEAKVPGKNFVASTAYGYVVDYTYVDLGLSVKWATCNVGANLSYEIGNYYAWGETKDKTTGYKSDWSDYSLSDGGEEGSSHAITKYCVASSKGEFGKDGFIDNKTVLEFEDDAAYVNWGSNWRMPTTEEQIELENSCFWSKTTDYNSTGTSGFVVYKARNDLHKGKKNIETPELDTLYSLSVAHIFLPATGQKRNNIVINPKWGAYWSSSLYQLYSYDGYWLGFDVNKDKVEEPFSNLFVWRFVGQAVRPVLR